MPKLTKKIKPDVISQHSGANWAYSPLVREHFFKPQNLLLDDPETERFDCMGIVGSPACGDMMRIWLSVDAPRDRISEFKWRTFGCASASATTSMLSVMVTEKGGMSIRKALTILPQDIVRRLGGLPDRKIHCSVLGDKGLRAALNDWFKKTGQFERIVTDGAKVLDPHTKVTEADIETAVLEGAQTLTEVQERTKVGIGYPECIPAVEELIRFYQEKYFGTDASHS